MRHLLLVGLCAASLGCEGASPELGLDAWLRVEGAQYAPGPFEAESGGPTVEGLFLTRPTLRPGEVDRRLEGALATEARAVTLGLEGDVGRWIVVAGIPDVDTPGLPSIDVTMSVSPELPLGPRDLLGQAFDAAGRGGSLVRVPLTAMAGEVPEGALVISLSWDNSADLDLRVVDPLGVEIHKGNINSWQAPPPGRPVDPDAYLEGAVLDFDSNAQCQVDGRRQENVVWSASAPPGRYTVRVDTFSLCGEAVAHWTVAAISSGDLVASAEGTSTPIDASLSHGPFAGTLALELDRP